MKTRIVFFGTPSFAVPFLQELITGTLFDVVAVITQTDKPVGRKQILTKPEVKIAAESLSIPIFQFQTLKTYEAEQTIRDLNADVFVVVAYGKLIPSTILQIPQMGCLNVHPSLLPKYRGPSPIQNTILNGDKETGVSIMLLDEGMDTGPILTQKIIKMTSTETFTSLEKKILSVAPGLLVNTLLQYLEKKIQAHSQSELNVSITKLLERIDGQIDWTLNASVIDQKIRAFESWPGSWFLWSENGQAVRVSVHSANLIDRIATEPRGTCFLESDHFSVVCGDSKVIELVEIQPDGKNKMSATDYVRGHKTILTTNLISS